MVAHTNNTDKKLGVAVFVKTPGHSPIKTRLAAGVGKRRSLEFYDLAVAAVSSVLSAMIGIKAFWAVAEAGGLGHWRGFPTLEQGEGGLGERMAHVYEQVFNLNHLPVLLGADAPQVNADVLVATRMALRDHDFVIGPARDGGFYLLAGRLPLPLSVFNAVPYSTGATSSLMEQQLKLLGTVKTLGRLTDADTEEDLPYVATELRQLASRTPAQQKLLEWLA